jgi:hypothetical protein
VKDKPKPIECRKNAENKRMHEEDIPPDVKPELEEQVSALCALQKHLRCNAHSRPGMTVYCRVELGQNGVKGGHREMSHEELTLWAQYIVSTNLRAMNENLPETWT